jgi:glucokinase
MFLSLTHVSFLASFLSVCANIADVVAAPGTGLGICLLISSGESKKFEVVPGESGHMPVSCLPLSLKGGDDDQAYEYLAQKLHSGMRPIEYEDVVSGRGLAAVMTALGEEVPENIEAKEIAKKAMEDGDEVAVRSVMVFYRTLMRAMQTLGVAVMCKGVIIAGDNQVINNPLLTDERVKELKETFTTHPRESWLSKMVILKQAVSMNLNIEGALYIAKDIALRH